MEKKLLMALGLYLCTPNQLELILNIICDLEFLLLLLVLRKKNYFIQPSDFLVLIVMTYTFVHTIFRVEYVSFFFVIFYFQLFVFLIYLILRRYKYTTIEKKEIKNDK